MELTEDFEGECSANMSDGDSEDDVLTTEEKDNLTQQFLSGALTFSEYSLQMDRNTDNDAYDDDTLRAPSKNDDEIIIKQVAEDKKARRRVPSRRKRKRNLPPALEGLMGQANLYYAHGEYDLAKSICMEIIRQVPSAPDPFLTLALIYESSDGDKAFQYSLIAAYLSPKDSAQWEKLANSSLKLGNIKQAITFLSKAIQADPTNVELYEARAKLQEENGDTRAFLKGYARLINQLGPDNSEKIVSYAKELTRKFIEENNYEQALKAMEQIFTKCPSFITLEEINIMTDILITLKQFRKCLDILTQYTNIKIEYIDTEFQIENDNEIRMIESCEIPNDIFVDLKAKCIVALIELSYIDVIDELLNDFLIEENPEVSGDLFLDIVEALMRQKKYMCALKYLEPLINSQNYSLAAVWLRYAECWVGCKQLKKAIISYEIVVKLSPLHLEARLQLSTLYKCFKQYQMAIDILHQDPAVEVLDSDALYRKTMLLYKVKNYDEFFQSGFQLLLRHCENIRTKLELLALMRPSVGQRIEALHKHRLERAEPLKDDNAPTYSNNQQPTVEAEFNLFLLMCKVAFDLNKSSLLERICFTALTSKKFECKTRYIIFLCLVSCIHNNNSYYGFNLVRDMVRETCQSNLWNLLNIVIQRADDSRHNRFIMRLLGREDAFSYLHILNANNCLVSGTYKYALNDYVSLFKVGPSSLLALLIAVTFLQIACQKFTAKKHKLVTQAYAFFKKYAEMRGDDMTQESNYNIARALHQLGLLSGAVHFYKLVLGSPPSKLILDNLERLDLSREAAYNLHLIYMQSNNFELARIYLENYITI
ncbi:hypothetical protein PV325_002936 [Microctonus aethiopoides]|uniref:General transcription factor 3C polypeptide 3 n=1 Tax=Microctonus aethiopoides TaxID=144406 RepID=A0AA39KSH6_9HYME|nr:hypothetical protein PV325_002936 [Microctonus aethiopoides]KAK0172104.1 hypothetical protein PV328_005470 [Microctonus aethiopoides]